MHRKREVVRAGRKGVWEYEKEEMGWGIKYSKYVAINK